MCWETNCPNMSCNSWCVENHASLLGVFDFWPGWCGRPTPAWRRRTSDSASWEATCTARWTTAASSWWPRSSGRLQHTNHKTHVKPTSTHEKRTWTWTRFTELYICLTGRDGPIVTRHLSESVWCHWEGSATDRLPGTNFLENKLTVGVEINSQYQISNLPSLSAAVWLL